MTDIAENTGVTVLIAATLRTFTDRIPEFTVEAGSVSEVIDILSSEYPDIRKVLLDDDGNIRDFINIYINDRSIRELKGLRSALNGGDTLLLLPAMAGGSGENPKIRPKERIKNESIIPDARYKEIKLDDKQISRYNNHLQLKDISVKGQKRIMASKVLIAGLGALGGVVAQNLAAAGVGTIGIADFDKVDLNNLQTQIIHSTRDVGRPKAASVKDAIKRMNPLINTIVHQERLSADNISEIISGYDIVVDATDNYVSRYLINDACVLSGKPEVYGAMYQFEGLVSVFDGVKGPCFRCQFPSPPPEGLVPTCSSSGTETPLPGTVGSLMANEVIKLITGKGEVLVGKILAIDIWNLSFRKSDVIKDAGCAVCGKRPTVTSVEEIDYEDFCGLKRLEEEEPVESLDPQEFARRLAGGAPLTIIDVREPHERSILRFPDAIYIPIGQLARRQNELDPEVDTVFICKEGKRSAFAIRTLREAGYTGPCYNLKGGLDASAEIVLPNEGAWL